MNKTISRFLSCMCLALWASILSAQTHWTFDYHQYQYDMSIFFSLQSNGRTVSHLDNYEVAAFVGDECRGISEFVTQQGTTYGYLRVYSNTASGETVTFKCYDKTTMEEQDLTESAVSFSSNALIGMPSSPCLLDIVQGVTPGDVDGDDRITINDAVQTINATFGTDPEGFNRNAADTDGDGRVTINDAILIIIQTF